MTMQYFGGKARIAKEIAKVLEENREQGQLFVELFCGGVNVTSCMSGDIIANDKNADLIELYKGLQQGWTPPDSVSEEEYNLAKITKDKRLKAFIAIGCSYSGKWFGGYARGSKGRNYAKNAKNSLAKKFKTLMNVDFTSKSYDDFYFTDALIYCDPPYSNTTGYSTGSFDSEAFWQWCRDMTRAGNTVIISEYEAPKDFTCIWMKNVKTDIRTKANGKEDRIEKLFIFDE